MDRPILMDYEGGLLGECLGNYRLVRTIGCGSMGEVYEAEHVLIGRRAAVKVLLPQLSRSAEAVSRFFNEARSAATLRHPGLIEVFDFGHHASGSAFIIMELLEGETLAETIERRGRLPVCEAIRIARKVASAMACAHGSGVVHRDLKPENLVLVPDEEVTGGVRVKVLDFGIAKLATASLFGARSTRDGQIMGTPAFMSPEQCHGASEVDERADIYALGCILYFMLTGAPPFADEEVALVLAAHLHEPPVPPVVHVAGLPARVNALVLHLLEKSPDDRPGSMDDLEALLASVLSSAMDAVETQDLPGADRAGAGAREAHWADLPLGTALPIGPVVIMPEPYYSTISIASTILAADAEAQQEAATLVPHAATLMPHAAAPGAGGGGALEATEPTVRSVRRPGRGRRWLVSGAAAALASAGLLSWRGLDGGAGRLAERVLGAVDVVEAAAEPVAPAPPPETPTSAPAATPVTDPPRSITLRITSRPSGASVVRTSDGARLGRTPLVVALPVGSDSITLRLRKTGFRSERISLPADRDAQAKVTLSPRPALPSRARASRTAGSNVAATVPPVRKPVETAASMPAANARD